MGNGALAEAPLEPAIRDRLLPGCTTRIEIRGKHAGTGFFVAPGLVATCHHVLESLALTTGAALPDVRVLGTDGSEYRVREVPDVSDAEDLAVLRIEPGHGHPCAMLITGLRGGDDLVTFGSPQKHPGGVPTELRAEGMTTEDPKVMKLSAGNVQPGMSGSPVLNLRTGGICGVLKRTRDSSQALGGYAIPIQSLFRLSPTLERLSRRFHQADRKWLDLLPPNQRALMASGRPGSGVHHPTRFFVVTVRQTGTGWMASAVEYPSGKATPALRSSSTQRPEVNVDLSSVRQSAARVFRYWGRRGRGDQRVEIELLGQILAAVLPDGIGAEFDALVANPARPIELVLRFETGRDDDLAYLPWEHLLLPHPSSSSDIYVAREDKFAFVRAIESEWRERDEQLGRGLSVLLIEVDPEPPPRHDEDRPPSCVSTVCDELEEKAEDLGIIVKRISAPTEDAIAREFAVGSYDIVHYVGFGRYLPVKPNPVDELALGGTGENAYVDPAGFRMVLAGSPPTLVVLQLCEGPKEDMPPDLSSFGPALLPPLAVYEGVEEEGTQAVIAYQFPLPRGLNVLFNGVLYEHLMAGESVQMAVQAGRRSIWRSSPNNRNCLAPATFLRRPGELAMTAGAIDSSALTRSSALTNNA